MSLMPELRNRIVSNVKKRVAASHFNGAAVNYADWFRRIDDRLPELLSLPVADFEDGLRSLLQELGTSHTAFYHEVPTRFPPQHTINATLTTAANGSVESWMFLDVFPDGPAATAGVNPGDLLLQVDRIDQAPPLMPSFAIGREHTLTIRRPRASGAREVKVHVPVVKASKQRPPIVEPKSITRSVLRPGVGLLKIVYFPGAFGVRFQATLDDAVSELTARGCDRLVVDLRGNIGGSLGFARLASYLCRDRLPIGHSLTPSRLRAGYRLEELPRVPMPATRMGVALALARFAVNDKSLMLLTQGLGYQRFHGRTVLLVNEWTNSAAEIVAAFAKEQALARVVGQKTRGNVLGASNFPVGDGYWLRIPVFGWFTSTGSSVEGIGVDPDIVEPFSVDALSSGEDSQLARAVVATEKDSAPEATTVFPA